MVQYAYNKLNIIVINQKKKKKKLVVILILKLLCLLNYIFVLNKYLFCL